MAAPGTLKKSQLVHLNWDKCPCATGGEAKGKRLFGKIPSPPFLICARGYFNYFRRKKNLPHKHNKTHTTAPDCKGTYLQVVLPLCFSLGKHRLSGTTHRASPAREQLLAAGHLNILNFDVVLEQFLRGGRAGAEGPGPRPALLLWAVDVHKAALSLHEDAARARCRLLA